MGAGSSNYYIVAVGTVFIAAVSLIMTLVFKENETYLIIVRASLDSLEEVRAGLFNAYQASKLRSETITDDYVEVVYQVKFKDESDVKFYGGDCKFKFL